jgi:hypothetical protein
MEMKMDKKVFKTLMKLFDLETVEILGDAAFAVDFIRSFGVATKF